MITIRDYGFNFNVIYNGDKKHYFDFFNLMNSLPDTKRLKNNKKGWKMPKCYLPELEKMFETNFEPNPWDYIGEGLKLSPYCYQKETIKFGVDNSKGLLILPCGAGKF